MSLPTATRRLLHHWSDADLDLTLSEARDLVIGKVLEEGDRRDLAWLHRQVGESAIRDWFERCGARLLSRRSRRFWALALGVVVEERKSDPLWLL